MRVAIPPDKLLHLAAGATCALAGLAAGLLAQQVGMRASPLWAGLAVCLVAALLREAWNRRQGGLFDWRDVAATVGGALPVLAAFWLGGLR